MAGWRDAPLAPAPQSAPSGGATPAWAAAPLAEAASTPAGPMDRLAGFTKRAAQVPLGGAEALTSLASSAVAAPAAGIAGIVQGVSNAAARVTGGQPGMQAADRVRQVQGALTYQPRTQGGQVATGAIAYPFEKLAEGADWAGQKVADATGSPLAGTVVNTALQAAPALATRTGRAPLVKAGRAVVERTTGRPTAAAAAQSANELGAARARAEAYVTRTAGLDWSALGPALQDRLTQIARSATALEQLDPKAVAREARLQSLPVPVSATRGQLERNPAAMRREANVAATEAGQPIADVYAQQNAQLLENLDVLKGKVAGRGKTASTARTPEDAGRSVQDAALRAKQQKAEAQTNAAYKAARATEPDAEVGPQPLYEMLEQSPEMGRLPWLEGWLRKNKVTATETAPDGTVVQTTRGVKLAELDDLRKKATAIAKTGGTDGYYAGQVLKTIDGLMDEVPDAAKAWKDARATHRAERTEFGDQGAVRRLVEEKPNSTDRVTALESTVDRIVGGSLEDIRTVKRSLLTGGDSATRTAGRQAWRDVRTQVIQRLRDEATKGVATMPDGSPNLQPGALKRAIDAIGPEKLNEVFGPGTARQLDAILKAAQDTKTMPATGGPPVGSSTVQNALAFLEKGLGRIPLAGPVADAAIGVVRTGVREAENTRAAAAATTTPLNEALSRASSRSNRSAAARAAAPYVPLSELANREQRPR